MSPFSDPAQLLAPADHSHAAAPGAPSSDPGPGNALVPVLAPEQAPGLDLAAQEVWFVAIVSFLSVVLLVGFAALVCVRQRHLLSDKNVGHYSGRSIIRSRLIIVGGILEGFSVLDPLKPTAKIQVSSNSCL